MLGKACPGAGFAYVGIPTDNEDPESPPAIFVPTAIPVAAGSGSPGTEKARGREDAAGTKEGKSTRRRKSALLAAAFASIVAVCFICERRRATSYRSEDDFVLGRGESPLKRCACHRIPEPAPPEHWVVRFDFERCAHYCRNERTGERLRYPSECIAAWRGGRNDDSLPDNSSLKQTGEGADEPGAQPGASSSARTDEARRTEAKSKPEETAESGHGKEGEPVNTPEDDPQEDKGIFGWAEGDEENSGAEDQDSIDSGTPTLNDSDSPAFQRLKVVASTGKLGIVVDNPSGDVPVVHAVKDTSALLGQVFAGDLLIGVDKTDCAGMSALEVARLIGSRSDNPQRELVLLRGTGAGYDM